VAEEGFLYAWRRDFVRTTFGDGTEISFRFRFLYAWRRDFVRTASSPAAKVII